MYFGNVPDDTGGEIIKQFINQWTEGSKEDIEERYSVGAVEERGAARFQSLDKMWGFMVQNKGNLQYKALGKTIYATLDGIHDPNPNKTKSIRKTIRAVLDKQGGDGNKVKEEMMKGTSYPRGRVYWRGERIAEWDEALGVLSIKGSGKEFEEVWKTYMGSE